LDISWFNNISNNTTPRNYCLGAFNIVEKFASPDEIKKFKKNRIYNLLVEEQKPYHQRSFVKERHFYFNPKISKLSDNTYIEGYWQSEKYFKSIENIIRQEVTLKKPFFNKYKSLIDKTNSIAIHIRKGDYVTDMKTNEAHGVCPLDYYYTAIKKIVESVALPHFFVFSDDITWAKNNLKIKHPVIFVSDKQNKNHEELMLMSMCKHQIIANSAFSWWGAWLNNNPNKIVIAPRKWFNNLSINTKDLIPEPWIKI